MSKDIEKALSQATTHEEIMMALKSFLNNLGFYTVEKALTIAEVRVANKQD